MVAQQNVGDTWPLVPSWARQFMEGQHVEKFAPEQVPESEGDGGTWDGRNGIHDHRFAGTNRNKQR